MESAMLGLAAKLLNITALMFTSSILPMLLFRKTVWLACRTVAALKFDAFTCYTNY
jgi:hypothetical protein